MGRDKASLPFGAESLLARVVRLLAPSVDDIVLSAAEGQHVVAGLPVVRDLEPYAGPVPALIAAWPRVRHELVLVLAVDTPLLQPAVIPLLKGLLTPTDEAVVPRVAGRAMPVCALYRRTAALAAARRLSAGASLHQLLEGLAVRWVDEAALRHVDPELVTFLPCNTDDDYQQALARAGLAPAAATTSETPP